LRNKFTKQGTLELGHEQVGCRKKAFQRKLKEASREKEKTFAKGHGLEIVDKVREDKMAGE
jgi:hypothetical protein